MTASPARARTLWGSGPLPAGAIPLAVRSTRAVLYMPTMLWVCAGGGALSSCPQHETQRDVLQAARAALGGWGPYLAALGGTPRRTCEEWEQGRRRPPLAAMAALHDALEARA